MKEGMTLEKLTGEVMREARSRHDYLLSTRELKLISRQSHEAGSTKEPASLHSQSTYEAKLSPSTLSTPEGEFGVTDFALEQIAGQVGMPLRYLKRLQEVNPNLLDININTLLFQEPKERLVRTLDGSARAVLSNRYRRLDNDALLEALFPVFDDLGGLSLGSSNLAPHKMYLKMVSPRLKGDVRLNDAVQAGLVISNSEVGCGAVSIELMIFRLVCTNGAILGSGLGKTRRYHIGKTLRGSDGSDGQLVLPEADDALVWDEVRRVVKESLHEASFQNALEMMKDAAGQKIEADGEKVTMRLADRHGLSETERTEILTRLLESGDMTRWGLSNAVTRMSQDVGSYERATELERLGGHLLSLGPKEWKGLSLN
jgi:hypothetical protein